MTIKQPDWVQAQHKTMTRWINSTLQTNLSDLTKDLQDGLVLIRLINHINSESEASSPYLLTPIYRKPHFNLQKIENLNDFLKFLQLVCKLNICNISADNILEGNLKLILGLIWSIFIYSTSNTFVANEKCQPTSLIEIKTLLLNWCNQITHKKALPPCTDFSKSWSLEISRPDLTFAAILSYYLPSDVVNYTQYQQSSGKQWHNMTHLLKFASEELAIPQLADVDDFNYLVPDEKCIIFYVLEWFKFFELNNFPKEEEETAGDFLQQLQSPPNSIHDQPDHLLDTKLDSFMHTIMATLKLKHKYETKSLRLVNQMNFNIVKLDRHLEFWQDNKLSSLSNDIGYFLNAFTHPTSDNSNLPASSYNFTTIETNLNQLISILTDFEHYRNVLKPEYTYTDFPEITKTYQSALTNLQLVGIHQPYQPPKSLTMPCLVEKFTKLTDLEMVLAAKLTNTINQLGEKWIDFNTYLTQLASQLESNPDSTKKSTIIDHINRLEYLISISHKLDYFQRCLSLTKSPSQLKTCCDRLDQQLHECSPVKVTFDHSPMEIFKTSVLLNIDYDLANLSFAELTTIVNRLASDQSIGRSFTRLVPSRTLILNRSESDFNIHYPSDESDDSNSLFDGLSKRVGGQLLGNCDKVYNLSEFMDRLENGFRI